MARTSKTKTTAPPNSKSNVPVIIVSTLFVIVVFGAMSLFWGVKAMNAIFGESCGTNAPSYKRIQAHLAEFNAINIVAGQTNQADIANVANGTCSLDVQDDYTISREFTVNATGGEMIRTITQTLADQGFTTTYTSYFKDNCSNLGVSKSYTRGDFNFTVVVQQKLDTCIPLPKGVTRVSTPEAFESVVVDRVTATY